MTTEGSAAIPTSTTLSAEERLQTIAKALQGTEVTDSTYLGTRRVTNTRGNLVPVRLYRQPQSSLFNEGDQGKAGKTLLTWFHHLQGSTPQQVCWPDSTM